MLRTFMYKFLCACMFSFLLIIYLGVEPVDYFSNSMFNFFFFMITKRLLYFFLMATQSTYIQYCTNYKWVDSYVNNTNS